MFNPLIDKIHGWIREISVESGHRSLDPGVICRRKLKHIGPGVRWTRRHVAIITTGHSIVQTLEDQSTHCAIHECTEMVRSRPLARCDLPELIVQC
jgi:hypothetical protein